MADPIIVTPSPVFVTFTGTGTSNAIALDLRLALEIARWDQIDLSVGVLGLSGAATVTIEFLSAMQAANEDATWGVTAATPVGLVGTLAFTTAKYQSVSLPASNVLLRYLRWRIYSTAAITASFTIAGMGRSKGS